MLLVPAEIRASSIHGVGLFLLAPVKKGDLIWRYDSRIDRIYSDDEFFALPEMQQKMLDLYAPWHKTLKLSVLYGDASRHINHSTTPNLLSAGGPFGDIVAATDLAADTELTTDYNVLCDWNRETGIL